MSNPNDKFFPVRGVIFQWTILFLAAAYICLPVYNPSFYGDLVVGRWKLHHDPFSYHTPDGTITFINWVYNIILAVSDNLGGFAGVIIFKIILIFATLLTVSYSNYRLSQHRFFAVFITLLAGMGSFYANEMTPALLGIFLFTWCWSKIYPFELDRVLPAYKIFTVFIVVFLFAILFLRPVMSGISDVILGANKSIVSLYNYQFAFLLILSSVALLFCYIDRFQQTKKAALFVILCFIISIINSLFVSYALFLISSICANLWGRLGIEKLGNLARGIDALSRKFDFIPTSGFAFLICCASIVMVYKLMLMPVVADAFMPKAAAEFLLKNPQLLPILTRPDAEAFLIYKFTDKKGELKKDIQQKGRGIVDANEICELDGAVISHAPPLGGGDLEFRSILCPGGSTFVRAIKNAHNSGEPTNFEIVFSSREFIDIDGTISGWTVLRRR